MAGVGIDDGAAQHFGKTEAELSLADSRGALNNDECFHQYFLLVRISFADFVAFRVEFIVFEVVATVKVFVLKIVNITFFRVCRHVGIFNAGNLYGGLSCGADYDGIIQIFPGMNSLTSR